MSLTLARSLKAALHRAQGGMSQPATLYSRSGPGATFSPPAGYPLFRVVKRPSTRRDIDADTSVKQVRARLLVTQADLDQAQAPAPKVSDRVTLTLEGTSWEVEEAERVNLDSAWDLKVVQEVAINVNVV